MDSKDISEGFVHSPREPSEWKEAQLLLEPEAEQDVDCIFYSILVESYKAICPVEVVHDVYVKTNGLGH